MLTSSRSGIQGKSSDTDATGVFSDFLAVFLDSGGSIFVTAVAR